MANAGPPRKRAKTTLTEWSKDQWAQFRDMYERYVFLWKEDVRGYSDDDEKMYLYQQMAEKLNETVDNIKKRIKSVRTQFASAKREYLAVGYDKMVGAKKRWFDEYAFLYEYTDNRDVDQMSKRRHEDKGDSTPSTPSSRSQSPQPPPSPARKVFSPTWQSPPPEEIAWWQYGTSLQITEEESFTPLELDPIAPVQFGYCARSSIVLQRKQLEKCDISKCEIRNEPVPVKLNRYKWDDSTATWIKPKKQRVQKYAVAIYKGKVFHASMTHGFATEHPLEQIRNKGNQYVAYVGIEFSWDLLNKMVKLANKFPVSRRPEFHAVSHIFQPEFLPMPDIPKPEVLDIQTCVKYGEIIKTICLATYYSNDSLRPHMQVPTSCSQVVSSVPIACSVTAKSLNKFPDLSVKLSTPLIRVVNYVADVQKFKTRGDELKKACDPEILKNRKGWTANVILQHHSYIS